MSGGGNRYSVCQSSSPAGRNQLQRSADAVLSIAAESFTAIFQVQAELQRRSEIPRARQEASALICATSTLTLAVTFATVNLQEDLRSVSTLGHAAGWSGLQTDGKGRNYFFMPNFNVILWRLMHKCVHTHSHTYGRHRCSFTLYVI